MNKDIEFGDVVEDIYSSMKGVVVAKTEFVNGCIQYLIQPKYEGKGPMPESIGIDSEALRIIKKKNPVKKEKKKKSVGGPMTFGIKQRGY